MYDLYFLLTMSFLLTIVPYVQNLSEKIKRVFGNYNISTVFKPHQTLRQVLVAPKDKPRNEEKSGVVYRVPCGDCDKVYVGETLRVLGERLKEHTADTASNTSAIAEHHKRTGHDADTDNVEVLCREEKLLPRKVREAIFIKKETSPTLNRDGGRELSKIYDTLLLETPDKRSKKDIVNRK